MTRWKSFTVETRREAVDALCHFFIVRGALGTAWDERTFGDEGDPAEPLPPPGETTRLTAWFPGDADLDGLKKEFLAFLPLLAESFGPEPAAYASADEVADEGWAEKWKEHFRPRRLGRRIVVRPSWERYDPAPGEIVITVDPGQAFGTGGHETTRLCLLCLEEIFASETPPRRVLDLGTGTGILGIAAAALGAERVLGLDVDPKAVETAAENGRINGVADRFRADTTPVARLSGEFDLVVANVHAEVLADLKAEIVPKAVPGGRLLLSGILADRAGWVAAEYEAVGCRLAGRRDEGPWTALLLVRGPEGR